MKICQTLGETCLITSDRRYTRLTENGANHGFYQNISIFVTDETADSVWYEIEHTEADFDFVLFDDKYDISADCFIYVEGAGEENDIEDLKEILGDKLNIIKLGFGKNSIPYSVNMFKAVEEIEYFKLLKPVDVRVSSEVSKILSPHVNMPVKNLLKVVARK
jgi:hypothetical protein